MLVNLDSIRTGTWRQTPVGSAKSRTVVWLPTDVQDEALRDIPGRIGRAMKRAATKVAKVFKRKPKPTKWKQPKPEPKLKARTIPAVRPKGRPGGIPPRDEPKPSGAVVTTPAEPSKSARPQAPAPSPKGKGPTRPPMRLSYHEPYPDDMPTTAPGPPIPHPKRVKIRRRKGGDVSHSELYKHVVRAIYQTGTQTGYAFRGSAAKSSQAIARAKLIKWKFAKRATKAGGVKDRFRIELTGRGQKQSWKHAMEPASAKRQKTREYMAIKAMDPL